MVRTDRDNRDMSRQCPVPFTAKRGRVAGQTGHTPLGVSQCPVPHDAPDQRKAGRKVSMMTRCRGFNSLWNGSLSGLLECGERGARSFTLQRFVETAIPTGMQPNMESGNG